MHLRRTPALLVGALLLATALTGCGTDATNRINQITTGSVNRDADIDVLGAVVVSAEDGSGTFVATFVNNSELEPASVETVAGTDPATTLTFDGDTSVDVAAAGMVNLADDGGFPVTGDFVAGDFLDLTVTFGDGSKVDMNVPVVTNCGIWEGLDGPTTGCESESVEPDQTEETSPTPIEQSE
jgi:hypothetical protein